MSYPERVLADAPAGYWRLGDEFATTAADASGHELHGEYRYQGGIELGVPGLLDRDDDTAARFTAPDAGVLLPSAGSINLRSVYQETITAWFAVADTAPRTLIYKQGGTSRALAIYVQAGHLYFLAFETRGPAFNVHVRVPIEPGRRYHAALRFHTGDGLTAYLDGQPVGTVPVARHLNRHTGQVSIGAIIGTILDHTGSSWAGTPDRARIVIDDVAVFSEALDPATLVEHYQSGTATLPVPVPVRLPDPAEWGPAGGYLIQPLVEGGPWPPPPAGGYSIHLNLAGGHQLQLPIELLQPGRRYRLRMRLRADAAGFLEDGWPVLAVLDGDARELPQDAPGWVEWTTTAERPTRLDVSNVSVLEVHDVELWADVPPHELRRDPLPGDVLALDVMAPRAESAAFRLDVSRLARAALDAGTPWPGTFVLGSSRLGAAYLDQPSLTAWWHSVLAGARSVTTRRGSTGTVVPVAEAGHLVAEFPNNLDPRAMGLRQGSRVRLYHWRERRLLFTGALTRARVQPYKPGGRLDYLTTIEAADAVAELAAITRHGAIGVEEWNNRAERLMASAPGIPWRIYPALVGVPRDAPMGNTVLESSLAKHLDILAASAAGAWWVDAAGVVQLAQGTPYNDVAATFTDARRPDDPAPWGYVDAEAGWDWQAVVSEVQLTNYGARWDTEQEGGAWVEDNHEATVTNSTLAATYGNQAVKLETNLDLDTDALDLAADLAHAQASSAAVTAVTLNALPAMDRAAQLDLFDTVQAQLRGEHREALLSELAHTITPRAWTVRAALIERMPS